jgi:hypothetical protein
MIQQSLAELRGGIMQEKKDWDTIKIGVVITQGHHDSFN